MLEKRVLCIDDIVWMFFVKIHKKERKIFKYD